MKHTLKKSLFFAAWCVAFLFGTVAFYSCSNEDLDEDSVQTKVELFRAKAKELSKKYGVDVTLNEENIEEIAATMTMEQFEKEFQMFATMSIDTIITGQAKKEMPKKLRFNTKKKLAESPEDSGRGDEYKGNIPIESQIVIICYTIKDENGKDIPREDPYTISGNASWTFKQLGTSKVDLNLSISGTPQATGGGTLNILAGKVDNGKVYFDAWGRVPINTRLFSRNAMCSVSHNGDCPDNDKVRITVD